MRKTIFFLILGSILFSCSQEKNKTTSEEVNSKEDVATEAVEIKYSYYGDTISREGAITIEEFVARMVGKDSVKTKIRARVDEVCQKKGCWMTVKVNDSSTMTIRFKDYGFFVPKDCSGKYATFEGWAYTDTISVDELKHYAEDAGATKEEIEKITEPEITLAFEAEGVIIEDPSEEKTE